MKLVGLCFLLLIGVAISTNKCGPGGVVCPSGVCHYPQYIEGCHIYSSSTSCHECEFNYVKDGNICAYSPPANNAGCCKAYSEKNGKCAECAPGLSLFDGSCKQVKLIGCIQKSSGNCLNCALGYTLFGGRCFKTIKGCQKYQATGDCEICEDHYDEYYGQCIPEDLHLTQCVPPFVQNGNGECQIIGCELAHEYGCAECAVGYHLLPSGTCKKEGLISGCQKYRSDGLCEKCSPPLYIENSGFCIPVNCGKTNKNGQCIQCLDGFFLNQQANCVIPHCIVSNGKQCLMCEKGFVQVLGQCDVETPKKVCTVCADGYYIGLDGQCHPKQPGCISYSRGVCKQCESQLYLTQNYECAIKEPGCVYKNGICAQCYSPFELARGNKCIIQGCNLYQNKQCIECFEPYVLTNIGSCSYANCYEVRNKRCIKCFEGYALQQNGFCYKVDPYCRAYDFSGTCIKCQQGFYLFGSECKAERFGCNYIDGRCVSCRAPFEYNPVQESCEIDGCLNYFFGGCKECDAGYDLRYNSCRLPHCLISHKGHCRQCNPDYILRSDGKCVNKDQFCWKYDNNGFCVECAPKYFLSKKTNKCQLREPGCHYNDDDRCYACDKPFFFDGVRCEIYGCLELNWKGCEQCFYPLQVNDFGLCEVPNCDLMEKGKCVACRPGYFIAKDGACKKEDPKCLVYGQRQCEKCVKGYRLDINGICEYADEHCWDFTKRGYCTNCDRLYFLNQHKKCQLKDRNCAAYSNGVCTECKQFFYRHRGLCYPNAKGCLVQKNIRKCLKCEDGYKLDFGTCTPELTRLSWNSIDMDFWGGQSDWQVEKSQQVFTVGKTDKVNLIQAISQGKSKVIYSTCAQGNRVFQVDDYRFDEGWQCESSKPEGQYLGIEVETLQTFYAVDIKVLGRNKMNKFAIEYSENGKTFKRVSQYSLQYKQPGVVQTFYFTPVYAKVIRIVVLSGRPHIKFEFYYSGGKTADDGSDYETYISETTQQAIQDSLSESIFTTRDSCVDKELCWMGLQLCEPKEITGFEIHPTSGSKGLIEAVSLKYSKDGVKFECYNSCKDIFLVDGGYELDPHAYGSKLRVYPTEWTGQPSYTVAFTYSN